MPQGNVKKVFADWHKKSGSRDPCTHTSFNGGSYCVPNKEENEDKIFHAMQADLKDGVPYYINEIATPVFRAFFDIDFMVPERLNDAQIESFAKIVHEVVARFFPSDPSICIPKFFEQIILHSESPMLCETRSSLEEILRPRNEISDKEIIKITGGRLDYQGRVRDVEWKTAPAADGTYQVHADPHVDEVRIVTDGTPTFMNPKVFQKSLESARRKGKPPPGALSVMEELEKIGSGYTAQTVFAEGEDMYFVNRQRDANGLLKHGIHIIFPEVKIQIEQALCMREALVERLITFYGVKNPEYAPLGWDDVVDNAVYGTGRGLRMYGANKTIKCPSCGGKKDSLDQCAQVGCNKGKIDVGRRHELHSVYINGERNLEYETKYRRQLIQILRRSSIRTVLTQPTQGWSRYPGCPGYGDALKTTINKSGNTEHKVNGKAIFRTDVKLKTANDVNDPEIFAMFESNIRRRFVSQYKNLRVVSVKKTENGFYFINVAGEGQHFCLNKMPPADHTSNTIFFQCTREGICVRCRCPKLTTAGRAKGMCKDFCSTVKPLHQSEIDKLFPESSRLSLSLSGKAVKKPRHT